MTYLQELRKNGPITKIEIREVVINGILTKQLLSVTDVYFHGAIKRSFEVVKEGK